MELSKLYGSMEANYWTCHTLTDCTSTLSNVISLYAERKSCTFTDYSYSLLYIIHVAFVANSMSAVDNCAIKIYALCNMCWLPPVSGNTSW